jgi:predicted transcriptional regulator
MMSTLTSPGKRFDRKGPVTYTARMELKLSNELQSKLERLAAQQGRDSQSLVHEAIERRVAYDEWFIRRVEEGLEQAQRRELLEHEEVTARMERLIEQNSACSE